LEISRFTRILGAFGGIAGGFAALHFSQGILHERFWALPVVAAIFAYGSASALFVLIAGDLIVRPKVTEASFPHPEK
jgi:hypothetical protein